MTLAALAKGFELLFMVDVGLFCPFIVKVGKEMLDIWIILIIIDAKIPNDVKAKLTQNVFCGKNWHFAMSSPISLQQDHGAITPYVTGSQSWRNRVFL
eukprot:5822228-Ditylum_brightwellii.AAC.1